MFYNHMNTDGFLIMLCHMNINTEIKNTLERVMTPKGIPSCSLTLIFRSNLTKTSLEKSGSEKGQIVWTIMTLA